MGRIISYIVILFTILAYLSVFVSPAFLWMAGFFSLSIPVLLIANIILLIYYLVRKKAWFIFHLLILVMGYKFFLISFSTSKKEDIKPDFTVLNYNVRVFNVYSHLNNNYESCKKMIDWVSKDTADIKCLQEFYHDEKSSIFNTVQRFKNYGEYQYFGKASVTNKIGAEFGLAIFSKYPIVNRGEVLIEEDPDQYAIYADVLIGKDTLRIYNVHLQSMKIDEDYLEIDRAREQFFNVANKLKGGFISRAKQVQNLIDHIDACPYEHVICGDLNDIPYSYTYFTLNSKLKNAFEEAANGFGFSYNGKLFFLRIDNQFYSDGLDIRNYTTHREIDYSDHFPIRSSYIFKLH